MFAQARLFLNGRSQAVRLPKEFRFEGDAVKISRDGDKVILEPIPKTQWPADYWTQFTEDTTFETPQALPTTPVLLD